MVPPTLLNRVRYMRAAANLERCHKKPHLFRYSVGHHSHDVVTLLTLAWRHDHEDQLPRAELLLAAHVHDHPEIIIGDIPSPTKDRLGPSLVRLEKRADAWAGFDFDLTVEEQKYLHAADRLELFIWCLEEERRGNQNFRDWAKGYHTKWNQEPGLLPPGLFLIFEEYRTTVITDPSDVELAEIGGMD